MKLQTQDLFKWCLWVALALSALAWWPLSSMSFTLPKLLGLHLALGVGCLLFLSSRFKSRVDFGARPLVLFLVFGYFLVNALYTIGSAAPLSSLLGVSESAQGFLTQIIYLTVFLLALNLDKWERGLKVIFYTNVVVVVYAILQAVGLDPLGVFFNIENYLGRSFSLLGHPDWLGVWLVLTFPLVCKPWRWTLILAQVVAVILAGSKAAVLGAMIFFIGMAMLEQKEKLKKNWGKIFVGMFLGVGLFIGFLMTLYPNSFLLLRSLEARKVMWENTWEMVKDQPQGYGLEMFTYEYPAYNTAELWNYEAFGVTIEHPHNQLLELWTAVGPWGAMLFYVLIAVIIVPHLHAGSNQQKQLLALGVGSFLCAQFFGFETVATSALLWAFLGILAHKNTESVEERTYISSGVLKLILVGLGVLNLFAFGLRWSQFEGESKWDRVKILESSAAILDQNILSEEDVNRVDGYLRNGEDFSGGRDSEVILLQALLAAKKGDEKLAESLYSLAKERNPAGPRTYFVGMKIFDALENKILKKEASADLRSLLPLFWDNPETEQGRIFQKNNPWVLEKNYWSM